MENIALTHKENAFHIEGFPDAVKVLKITGRKSRRLADLALHKVDLDFALVCLETINSTPSEPFLMREVLCQSALIRFIKCFGQSKSRFSLDPKGGGRVPERRRRIAKPPSKNIDKVKQKS
jgi:hypothetical protein